MGQGIVGRMSDATRRSYDRVAVQYAAEIGGELAGKPLDRALLNAFAELVAGPVLNVGASPGHVADYLVWRGVAVVSTDISLAMCGLASQAGLPSVGADMTALPFGSDVVGGIVCLYAVIHLDAAQRTARAPRRPALQDPRAAATRRRELERTPNRPPRRRPHRWRSDLGGHRRLVLLSAAAFGLSRPEPR